MWKLKANYGQKDLDIRFSRPEGHVTMHNMGK